MQSSRSLRVSIIIITLGVHYNYNQCERRASRKLSAKQTRVSSRNFAQSKRPRTHFTSLLSFEFIPAIAASDASPH